MALLTLQNGLVFPWMALCTKKGCVFSTACLQQIIGFVVAGSTCLLSRLIRADDLRGPMGRMAGQAICLRHLSSVGIVAFHTLWNVPVFRVMT